MRTASSHSCLQAFNNVILDNDFIVTTKQDLIARTNEIRPAHRVGFSLLSLTSDTPINEDSKSHLLMQCPKKV